MPSDGRWPGFVETLAAWCVVPYDRYVNGDGGRSSEGDGGDGRGGESESEGVRTGAERAEVLTNLGFDGLAWDWRDEHVAVFEEQLDALQDRNLDLTAIWAPVPDATVSQALEAQVRAASGRGLKPQLWACAEFGAPGPVTEERDPREFADRLEPIARLAAETGLTVALYNHLGWAGEPLNQLRIIEELDARGFSGAGIAYMQHHGHAHIDDFAELWPQFQHAVVALGLNGMRDGAHWGDGKVLPYGHGPRDLELARVIEASGWRGTVALLGHTMDPIEDRLGDDLAGLEWVARALAAKVPEPHWPH